MINKIFTIKGIFHKGKYRNIKKSDIIKSDKSYIIWGIRKNIFGFNEDELNQILSLDYPEDIKEYCRLDIKRRFYNSPEKILKRLEDTPLGRPSLISYGFPDSIYKFDDSLGFKDTISEALDDYLELYNLTSIKE